MLNLFSCYCFFVTCLKSEKKRGLPIGKGKSGSSMNLRLNTVYFCLFTHVVHMSHFGCVDYTP